MEEGSSSLSTPTTDFSLSPPEPLTARDERIVFVDRDSRRRILLLHRVGVFSTDRNQPVYKGIRIFPSSIGYLGMTLDDVITVVKYVNTNSDEYQYLQCAVERSQFVPPHPHLIPIVESFIDRGNHVVAFPFMRGGSIRQILLSKYPNGMPEDWILLILKGVLSGLAAMHANGVIHAEVHAGNIFLSGEPKIKLAYAASAYTPKELQPPAVSSTEYFPSFYMSYWAAAPEAYTTTEPILTSKVDTWMVGITALELACGRLWVKDRTHLTKAIQKMNKKQELPTKKPKAVTAMRLNKKKKKVFELNRDEFSKSFENLVLMCLRWEADSRPTATQLLTCTMFRRMATFIETVRTAAIYQTLHGLNRE